MTDGELRLAVVSRNIRSFQVLCILPRPCSQSCHECFAALQKVSYSGIVFSPFNVKRQQRPALAKSFLCWVFKCCPPASKSKAFKMCMSCQFQLQPRIHLLWLGSLWKGLRTFNLRCILSISAYIRYLQALFINILSNISIFLHTCGFGSNEVIKISSDVFIQVAFAWEREIRMRFSLV